MTSHFRMNNVTESECKKLITVLTNVFVSFYPKFEFLVDLTENGKRQFYLESFPKVTQNVLLRGQKRRKNWSDLFTMKKWNENWVETADTFILQRMTLSGRSLIKHVQTWKHNSVVQHTQGELGIVCMDKHFVRNVVSVIESTIVWNGYKTERGL